MRHGAALLMAALVALVALAACAPLPRPFKDDMAKRVAPAQGPLGAAIAVAPPEGGPPGIAGPIADTLVERLRGIGIPATSDGALTAGLLLNGRYVGAEAIRWSVLDVDGAERLAFVTGGGAGAAAMAAERVALFLGRDPAGADPAAPAPTGLAFLGVDGAPGSGNRELARAFTTLAREAGLPLSEDDAAATLALRARVALRPLEPGTQEVRLDWIVTDRAGAELGRLTQARAVPRGSLDGRWGALAYDAALATVRALEGTLARIEGAQRARGDSRRRG